MQLVTTKDGIPIAFHFTPGKTPDAKALGKMIDKLLKMFSFSPLFMFWLVIEPQL